MGAQDATLRSGISQVVSMNKRGTAFGAFNAAYGVLWFLGSVTMGVLYDYSLFALVVFGIARAVGCCRVVRVVTPASGGNEGRQLGKKVDGAFDH